MSRDDLKRAAGDRAAAYIASGMVVGLGSGSTARYATLALAEKLRSGALQRIVAIPTSEDTAALAQAEGIPLATLEEQPQIAVTIDGADEVDPQLNVTKGLGGKLLREKIVAFATAHEIIVVDESKLVERLGTRSAIPVEVCKFGWCNTERALAHTGARTALRTQNGAPLVTDEGNYIIDCTYAGIAAPVELSIALHAIPGVVEHGLFLGMVQTVVIASPTGVRILER